MRAFIPSIQCCWTTRKRGPMFLNPTGISAISTARPPGERAPGVVPPLDPIGRGPLRETVAGRWCAPCEKVLGSHAGLGALGHSGEQVGHEVGAAALPTGTGKHRGDGVLQPLVGIGGYQFHPAEPPSRQRAEEGQPEGAGPENSPPLLPNESARPSSIRESRHRQTFYLPWPTLVRGRRGGSAWPGGLRFGWRGYSEHRMLLVARLSLHCTAPRQQRKYAELTRGITSQHSIRTTGFQPSPH